MCRASAAVAIASSMGLPLAEVEYDILGGLAVFIDRLPRTVWISLMNDSSDSVVFADGFGPTIAAPWYCDSDDWERIAKFINPERMYP